MAISDELGGDGAVKASSFVAAPELESVAPAINPLQPNVAIAAAASGNIQVSNLAAGVAAAAPSLSGGTQGVLANAVIDTDKISGVNGSANDSAPVTTSDLAVGGGTSIDLSSATLSSTFTVDAADLAGITGMSGNDTLTGIVTGIGGFGS